MTALLNFYDDGGRIRAECADDGPVLWVRDARNTVSVELTPRVIEQLHAALMEARRYHAMTDAICRLESAA